MTTHDPRDPFTEPDGSDAAHPRRIIFARPDAPTLSELLAHAADGDGPDLSVAELVHALSGRGLAPVVMMMGILNILTIIPGSSTIMGLPLIFLGISLVSGAKKLWLPRRFRDHRFQRAMLLRVLDRALPHVRRFERLAHPRYWPGPATEGIFYRIYGAVVLILGLCVALPIPFGNTMPALAIVVLSLGFVARDGLWILGGLFMTTLAIGIVIGVGGAIAFAGASIFGGAS